MDDDALGRLPEIQYAALEQALRRRARSRNVDPTAVALATLGVLRMLSDSSPTLVAVDDLQWVDAPSARALAFALRRLDEAPVGFVATVRAGFESALTGMAGGEGELSTRIELAGLDKRHLAQLVLERTGRTLSPPQLGKLAELSDGNPFYALELAATGDSELRVPKTLAAALRTRLSALPETARRAGLTVATLGRVDEAVIRRLHGAGLDELRAAGVVDERSGALWFAHPLLASTLARDAHARGAARRAPRAGRRARGSRRARPPPRSRHGRGERAGCSRARARCEPPRRPRSAGDRRAAGRACCRADARG